MQEALKPLGGHPVFLLMVQLALLLAVARIGSELAKRVALPAVIGELFAGLLLGPSVFGHFLPTLFALVFPAHAEQNHLLEVVGTLGMVLLMLLTGLETDLRLLKNLGRAALIASASGMLLPFACGFGLGLVMPDGYLAKPDQRVLFALFLATAMAISAMPVIAKILMDLDLTRRNIGLVILSAGVVDDTAGWLILSLIAGAATHGKVHFGGLLLTLALTALFLAACAFVLYPLLRILMRWATTAFETPDTDLVLIVVATALCAAATESIGVHAVFGAFICGTVLRQVPLLREESVHKLEGFVFSVLAPVFFGIVGLKVDLWSLSGGAFSMMLLVLGVACAGKLIGCTVGGLWGGLRFWESLSIAVAMNARGAMGLVLAMIGLGLGILNQQTFSIIVVMAIVTSFMAPIGLRLTMPRVRITEEEAQRLLAEDSKGAFDPERLRVLVPTAGGPHAIGAANVALTLAHKSTSPVEVLYVDTETRWYDKLLFRKRGDEGRGIERHLSDIQKISGGGMPPVIRRTRARNAPSLIIEEAKKGFDLVMVGASLRSGSRGAVVGGPIIEHVVEQAPCHVAIVKGVGAGLFRSLLVPIDGRTVTRVAAELALRYAEAVEAELTLASVGERPRLSVYELETSERYSFTAGEIMSPEEQLERVSRAFLASKIKPHVLHLPYVPEASPMIAEAASGRYDAVFIGAENRAVQHRLFFGYENERLIRLENVAAVVVVPNLGQLG